MNLKYLLFPLLLFSLNCLNSFQIGEKLTYEVKYGIVTAGQMSLEVNETHFRSDLLAYKITYKAWTSSFFDNIFKVRDELETIMDMERMIALRFSKRLNEGSYRQYRVHFYYPEQGTSLYMRYQFKSRDFIEEMMEIEEDTQDIISALYWLRREELLPGDSKFINITTDGRNYEAEVRIVRTEMIDTIWGKKECLLLEPLLKEEAIENESVKLWITNDEHKIPVRMDIKLKFGSFSVRLIRVENVSNK